MNKPINPYRAGTPLREGKGFFGRQDILDWVTRELRNPSTNALVLFGQRRIGKTSLLLQLQHTLRTDAFMPIYFDLQDQATSPLGHLLSDLADKVAEAVKPRILKLDTFDHRGSLFQHTFLPQLYQILNNRRPVFLLDEFDVFDKTAEAELPELAAARTLFPFLRRVMTEEPRPAFVFAVGRRADDLSLDFTATFKASHVKEVWVLDDESAEALVRQAETNGTLRFTNQAVKHILNLTNYHPYLTQLLCQRIWERAYARNHITIPRIEVSDVKSAIDDALNVGNQALVWLWNGLNPAEKIYASALAEAAREGKSISEDQVRNVLTSHAARLRTREVEMAPRDLVKRQILKKMERGKYRFAVELFCCWVRFYRPLNEVKDELDRVEPLAENFFQLGNSYFKRHQWDKASQFFREALQANPVHFRSQLYLGEVLLAQNQIDEAVNQLEQAYKLDKGEAKFALFQALLAQAKFRNELGNDEDALATCERALQVSPNEREIQEIRTTIWTQRGDNALIKDQFDMALAAFQNAGNNNRIQQVLKRIQRQVSYLFIRYMPPSEYKIASYSGNPTLVDVQTIHTQVKFSIQQWRNDPIKIGMAAFRTYLTDEVQQFIKKKKHPAILLTTDTMDIPFELLHDGKQFLCLSHPFSRRIELRATPKRFETSKPDVCRALVIGNPTGNLEHAEQEARSVADLLENSGIQVDRFIGHDSDNNLNRLVTLLTHHSYHLIHYAGHGFFNKRDPALSGLFFDQHRRMMISADELQRILRGPAFIFLSAGWAAAEQKQKKQTSFQGRFIHGLALAALKGGACGCLGPMWEIEDRSAKGFALAFYRQLLLGSSIGEAVLRARQKVRRREIDCWASWALFGDPFYEPLASFREGIKQ